MKIWNGYQKGVNLGGWFSQCDHTEERYDTFIKDEDFAVIKSWGADHVRLPIDYELLENNDAEPLESGYARLQHVLDVCRENGLNVIFDLHKTAGFSFDANEGEAGFFDSEKYQERFYRLWERIAARFGHNSGMLAFELLNEITEQSYCAAWNRIAAECIRRIRAKAPDVPILVGGYWHNSARSVKDIAVPLDENTVYNFHCYEPLIFTHQGANWIPGMDPDFRMPVTAAFGDMDKAAKENGAESFAGYDAYPPETTLSAGYYRDFMAEAVRTAEERGVPLYCGDYGVIDRADPKAALAFFGMIHEAFESYGIGRAAWSYREMDFGLSDARMDAVRLELIKLL